MTAPWSSRIPVFARPTWMPAYRNPCQMVSTDWLTAEPGHNWPDPCTDQRDRPRCVLAQHWEEVFISTLLQKWKAGVLRFCGGEERSGHAITNCVSDRWSVLWPTHSTVEYIDNHPSTTTLHPPKYRICSMRTPTYKSPGWKWRILFTKQDFFTKYCMLEIKEKNPKKRLKIREKFPVWLPSHPHFYDMEADCFPGSENAENKPDLS